MKELQEYLSGRQLLGTEIELEKVDLKTLHQVEGVSIVPAVERKGKSYRCVRCNQMEFAEIEGTDIRFCTHCLQLGRISSKDLLYRFKAIEQQKSSSETVLSWRGTLSQEQQRASNALIDGLANKEKVHIIQAVTGAGKTEMIFSVIDKVLVSGGRVALVSPRIDVCLELVPRIKAAFEQVDLITLHGRMAEVYRYTPLVIATNHQLLKFYQAFDLIIVDEVDAFPLAGDKGLHFGVKQALKSTGKLVYLTATPDDYLNQLIRRKKAERTILPARFHRFPLPEPKFKWIGDWRGEIQQKTSGKLSETIHAFIQIAGIKLIFMPDIKLAMQLYEWMKEQNECLKLEVVHAKDPDRIEKVQRLRDGAYDILISTTILERGVTFTNCHVLIVGAEDRGYGASALIQMSGRVGRKADFPNGALVYGHYGISWSMLQAQKNIRKMNQLARKEGLIDA